MREEWKEYKLGDLITIKHGYAFKGEFITLEETNNILLTPGNFKIGGGFKDDKLKYYNGPIPKNYVLKKDDVIVTMTDLSKMADTLGFSAKVPKGNKIYLHNQRIGLVEKKNNDFDIDFIYWLLRFEGYQKFVAGSATGATVKHTSPNKIYAFKFKAPAKIDTQRRIASILSAYDDLIENNLKRIKLLEEMAQKTYEEWFVRMKFPGYETAKFDKETGLPEGWKKVKLGEVAKINSQSLKNDFNGKILYIDIAGVSPNRIDSKTEFKYSDAPGRAKRIVKQGDIIWSCVRPNRKSHAVIWNPEKNLIASTGFCVISPKKLPTSYLYQFLTMDKYVGYLSNLARGAAYPAVKPIDFINSEIIVPTDNLISMYEKNYGGSLEFSWNLQTQNQRLKEARDILLPRLMTGTIDPEEILGQVVEKTKIIE